VIRDCVSWRYIEHCRKTQLIHVDDASLSWVALWQSVFDNWIT
jgi:hypothetical protein